MSTNKPFALSVKVVIGDGQGRVLLVQRSMASRGNPGKWDFPGGKLDPGESFDQALLREVAEETGLCVTLTGVAGAAESESPALRVVYLFMEGRLDAGEVRLSDEHMDYRWVFRSELPSMDIAPQFGSIAKTYAARAERDPKIGE